MLNFSVGKSTKKYTHNKDYRINTTANFGYFQPTLCEFLSPNDNAIMKDFRQLIRNGVMPSPTFGDIKCVNNFYFVKASDVYPQFEAFVSGQNVHSGVNKSYIPTSLPFVTSKMLVALLCLKEFSFVTMKTLSGNKLSDVTTFTHSNFVKLLSFLDLNIVDDNFDEPLANNAKFIENVFTTDSTKNVAYRKMDLSACDFVVSDHSRSISSSAAPSYSGTTVFGIRLNSKGRRLFKILKGLGYSLDPMNNNPVSALPIFAYYKAWYDNYAITRNSNFQSTNCYSLIREIFDSNIVDLFNEADMSGQRYIVKTFVSFLNDLANCYYSYSDDFYSAHFSSVNGNVRSVGVNSHIDNDSVNGTTVATSISTLNGSSQVPVIRNSLAISDVAIRTLSRLTKFVNKNSLIGSRVKEYISAHFGSAVSDSFFGVSYTAATFVTDVRLNDMVSTSDTVGVLQGQGEHLGARAGIGEGFSQNSFNFEAPTHGFLIGMMAIYPVGYYTQGDDPSLYMRERFDVPTPDFDALGYELTPLGTVVDGNYISTKGRKKVTGSSFGFVPRYSKYKVKKSILNGDMALRSTFDSFKAFHLERYIVENGFIFDSVNNVKYYTNDIPIGGEHWRAPMKYPQLGYFNRIFLNSGFDHVASLSSDGSYYDLSDDYGLVDDNFTIQCNCEFEVSNRLKPLGMSYDTYDDEVDNDTTTVNNV